MNRRRFLGQALGTYAATLHGQQTRRPNVLLLVAGGWRGQAVPAAGAVRAPNLARLAAAGASFARAYTPNPAAELARAALDRGRFPHLQDGRPIGELLGQVAGSATWVEDAVAFIRGREEPFFLTMTWERPALGEAAPESVEPYAGRGLTIRRNVPAATADAVRQALAEYYARCSAIDSDVGRLLDVLEEQGSADDTIVVFTSDRGWMLGSHGLSGDGEPYEEAVRVPLWIRWPEHIRRGLTVDMPVSTIDLAATLFPLAGVTAPADLQGRDLSDWLLRGVGTASEAIYCQGRLGTEDEWRMVVRGLDKVVVNRDLKVTHLYNLGQDPYEMTNLVVEKSAVRKRDEMGAILRDWMRRTRDRFLPSGLKLRD